MRISYLENISKFLFKAYHRYFCTVTQSINYLRSLLDNSICFSKFAKWAEQKDPLKSRDKIKGIFKILKNQRLPKFGCDVMNGLIFFIPKSQMKTNQAVVVIKMLWIQFYQGLIRESPATVSCWDPLWVN